jgi:Mn-dependent DtxR family transcriptional regulator
MGSYKATRNSENEIEREYLTRAEFAKELRISLSTVKRMIEEGRIVYW